MADPFFCPAGLWPASMLSEEKTIMAQGERSEPIFLDDFFGNMKEISTYYVVIT